MLKLWNRITKRNRRQAEDLTIWKRQCERQFRHNLVLGRIS